MSNPTHKIAFYAAALPIKAGDIVSIVDMIPRDPTKEKAFTGIVPASVHAHGIALNDSHKFGDIVEIAEFIYRDVKPDYQQTLIERHNLSPE